MTIHFADQYALNSVDLTRPPITSAERRSSLLCSCKESTINLVFHLQATTGTFERSASGLVSVVGFSELFHSLEQILHEASLAISEGSLPADTSARVNRCLRKKEAHAARFCSLRRSVVLQPSSSMLGGHCLPVCKLTPAMS